MNDILQPGNVIFSTRNLEGNNLRTLLVLSVCPRLSVEVSGGFGPHYAVTALDEQGRRICENIRLTEQYRWFKLEL